MNKSVVAVVLCISSVPWFQTLSKREMSCHLGEDLMICLWPMDVRDVNPYWYVLVNMPCNKENLASSSYAIQLVIIGAGCCDCLFQK